MQTIQIEVPEEIFLSLKETPEEFTQEVRMLPPPSSMKWVRCLPGVRLNWLACRASNFSKI